MTGTFQPFHDAFSAFQLDFLYLDELTNLLKRAYKHSKMLEVVGLSNSANHSRRHQIGHSKHVLYKFCFSVRSSHQRCSIINGVLRNFAKFTVKHLRQSLSFNKVAGLRPKNTCFREHSRMIVSVSLILAFIFLKKYLCHCQLSLCIA